MTQPNSPYINRFLQPDTIVPDQTNPQSWNRFSYALSNPIVYSDPDGHTPVLFLAAVFVVAALLMTSSTELPQTYGPREPVPFGDIRRDAVIGSVSASESLGFFNEAGLMASTVLEYNKVRTVDGKEEQFITSSVDSNPGY